MLVGHTAVALVAKAHQPRTSLGVYLASACALDLIWPIFLLLGVERVSVDPATTAFTQLAFDSYPWSHSLAMAIVWALVGAWLIRRGNPPRQTATLVFLLVISHWVLDLVTHRPDLPLWPGRSPLLGLGLWNSVPATLAVEGALFLAGATLYVRRMRAVDRTGVVAFWLLVSTQVLLWATQPWSPPPPPTPALAWLALVTWLFPFWAMWADAHRKPVAEF